MEEGRYYLSPCKVKRWKSNSKDFIENEDFTSVKTSTLVNNGAKRVLTSKLILGRVLGGVQKKLGAILHQVNFDY